MCCGTGSIYLGLLSTMYDIRSQDRMYERIYVERSHLARDWSPWLRVKDTLGNKKKMLFRENK